MPGRTANRPHRLEWGRPAASPTPAPARGPRACRLDAAQRCQSHPRRHRRCDELSTVSGERQSVRPCNVAQPQDFVVFGGSPLPFVRSGHGSVTPPLTHAHRVHNSVDSWEPFGGQPGANDSAPHPAPELPTVSHRLSTTAPRLLTRDEGPGSTPSTPPTTATAFVSRRATSSTNLGDEGCRTVVNSPGDGRHADDTRRTERTGICAARTPRLSRNGLLAVRSDAPLPCGRSVAPVAAPGTRNAGTRSAVTLCAEPRPWRSAR